MTKAIPRSVAAALALSVALCSCDADDAQLPAKSAAKTKAPPPSAAANELIPVDVNQLLERIRSNNKRGTLVNVWASWCGSCRDEIPMLLSMRDDFAREGIDFVFVSADEPAARPAALEEMRKLHGPLPTLAVAGSMGTFKQALRPDWRGAIPATFLFDATAKLRYFWEGPVYEHEIAPILQGFLAGAVIDGETRPPLRGGPG